MQRLIRWFPGVLLCLLSLSGAGQPRPAGLPVGQFLTDTIEIGRPFQYSLTYRHDPKVDVLFPDTSQHFRPFRVTDLTVTPTLTTGNLSRDSAVYTLVSFSVDSLQWLGVPVRMVNAADCTALLATPDTVFLRSRLRTAGAASTAPRALSTATQLAPLQQQFNYPRLATAVLLLSLVVGIVLVFFGRALQRQWRLFRLSRRHSRYLAEHDRLASLLNSETVAETANQLIVAWKAYMEQLEGQSYAALTTSEIADRTGDDRVADALRTADRMIYGGAFSLESAASLRVLRDVAEQTYLRRRQQIRLHNQPLAPNAPAETNPTL